jgi:hypothetical protein
MLYSETLYVDCTKGRDDHPGTEEQPLKTIGQAVALANDSNEPGPTTIRIAAGLYNLTEAVVVEKRRDYSQSERLTFTAMVLPDNPRWEPALMPVLYSTSDGIPYGERRLSACFKIEVSHVTIQGLKFLGNPKPKHWNYSIYRQGKSLEDLVITQCQFVGNRETIPLHVSICANGHGVVLDHNVFYGCGVPVIFWNAEGGVSRGDAMHHCIVAGATTAAVWTCDTAEDFDFHHNVITGCRALWMRPQRNHTTYTLRDSILTDYETLSEYGSSQRLSGPTGPEVQFNEHDIIHHGPVSLVKAKTVEVVNSPKMPKDCLHVQPGTLGSELGAGLFKWPTTK